MMSLVNVLDPKPRSMLCRAPQFYTNIPHNFVFTDRSVSVRVASIPDLYNTKRNSQNMTNAVFTISSLLNITQRPS